MMKSLLRAFIGLAFGAAIVAGPDTPAAAQAKATKTAKAPTAAGYDGLWTVLIVTQSGPCDRSYRYPVRISRGNVRHAGGEAFFSIQGRVNARGAVIVTLLRDGQQAHGSGRLSGKSGGGSWTAGGGTCSGQWSASRRGLNRNREVLVAVSENWAGQGTLPDPPFHSGCALRSASKPRCSRSSPSPSRLATSQNSGADAPLPRGRRRMETRARQQSRNDRAISSAPRMDPAELTRRAPCTLMSS